MGDIINFRLPMLAVLLLALFPHDAVHGFFMKKVPSRTKNQGSSSSPLFPTLEKLINESQNGIDTTTNGQVKALMTQISESRKGDQRKNLSGQWELVYTTEKEINFFKTSWPFAKVDSITQVLDLYESGTVSNAINFVGGATFLVDGTVMPSNQDNDPNKNSDCDFDRVAFEFTSATAKVWNKSISLPPTGAGWFDTMYVDDTYRLSQDSRGDWSVFRRM